MKKRGGGGGGGRGRGEMVYSWKYVRPYEHWVGNVNYSLWEMNKVLPIVTA